MKVFFVLEVPGASMLAIMAARLTLTELELEGKCVKKSDRNPKSLD
jgi:hypothetical protein